MAKKNATAVADRSELAAQLKAQGLEILQPVVPSRTVIPFGISSLDHDILGTGGVPCGVVIQFWGPKSAGKTTLTYRHLAMAQRQRPDRLAVYYDSEYAYNRDRAQAAGIDVDLLQVIQGNNAEEVFERILKYAKSGATSTIVMDSLGALGTSNIMEGKVIPGEFAKMTTGFIHALTGAVHKNDSGLVFANQVRQKIGVMYGDPTDHPGGEAYKHAIQLSLRLRRVGFKKEAGEDVAVEVAVTVDKNKFAPERKTAEGTHPVFYFENGIEKSLAYSLYDDALRTGILQVRGAWVYLFEPGTEDKVAQWNGKEKAQTELIDDVALAAKVRKWVYGSDRALS